MTALETPQSPAAQRVGSERLRGPWWERIGLFALCVGGYVWVGNWMVVQLHVVGFDTLDDQLRALMIWHNDPAKLGAIGWQDPPLIALANAPAAIFAGPVSNLMTVPVASGVAAWLLAVTINNLLRRLDVPLSLRLLTVLVVALNPLVVFEATTGRSSMIWVALLVAAVAAMIAWYDTADVRHVMTAGLLFAPAVLAGFSSLAWLGLAMVLVAVTLAAARARSAEIEGTILGLAAPGTYVIVTWTALAWIASGALGSWVRHPGAADGSIPHAQLPGEVLDMVVAGSPITFLVLPALIATAVVRRDVVAAWLASAIVLAVLVPAAEAWWRLAEDPLRLDDVLATFALSVVGGIWLTRQMGSTLPVVATVLCLGASVPWTLSQMHDYPRQEAVGAFADAITTGDSQEGALTASGRRIGIADELAMAEQITALAPDRGSIFTDDTATYGVMLLTGHPEWFLDRVDEGDDRWSEARADVPDRVEYLLISSGTGSADALADVVPFDSVEDDPRFSVVDRTQRYVLLHVQPGTDLTAPSEERKSE